MDVNKWIIDNLSNATHIVCPTYTKNDYKYIRDVWPDVWKLLDGNTFNINGKSYTFKRKIYNKVTINGVVLNKAGRSCSTHVIKMLSEYIDNHESYTTDDIIKLMYEWSIEGNSGASILQLVKKIDESKFHEIQQYCGIYLHEREAIYRYINKIDVPPNINGIPLQFHTYKYGYMDYSLYTYLKCNTYSNNNELVRLLIRRGYNGSVLAELKKYFSDVLDDIRKTYPNIKNDTERIYCYAYSIESPKLCKICGTQCKFSGSYVDGYHDYCSYDCKCISMSVEAYKKYDFNIKDWKQYKRRSYNYMRLSYNKFKSIINPTNLIIGRGRGFYHIDHKIPIFYGYVNNIDPKIISHYKNLQILEATINAAKGSKLIMDNIEIENIIDDIKKDGVDYYENTRRS